MKAGQYQQRREVGHRVRTRDLRVKMNNAQMHVIIKMTTYAPIM